jgi:methyl-accepting chemotaxis protein
MLQQLTRFERSTPRMLAFVLLGVGFIGLGLFLGGDIVGLGGLSNIFGLITMAGFVGGGVFLALYGSTPIAVAGEVVDIAGGGNETTIEVRMSNELHGEMKRSFEEALARIEADNRAFVKSAGDIIQRIAQESSAFKDLKMLADLDIRNTIKSLQSMQGNIDVSSLNEAIQSIRAGARSVNNNLDELANISHQQVQKVEAKLAELSEDIEASHSELKRRVSELSRKFKAAEEELARTITSFEQFNRI